MSGCPPIVGRVVACVRFGRNRRLGTGGWSPISGGSRAALYRRRRQGRQEDLQRLAALHRNRACAVMVPTAPAAPTGLISSTPVKHTTQDEFNEVVVNGRTNVNVGHHQRHAALWRGRGRRHLSRRHLGLSEGARRRGSGPRAAAADRRLGARDVGEAFYAHCRSSSLALGGPPVAAQRRSSIAARSRSAPIPTTFPFPTKRKKASRTRSPRSWEQNSGSRSDYAWSPQVIGFVRNTLRAHLCDLVMGAVAGDDIMQTTNPYYFTTYVMLFPLGQRPQDRRNTGSPPCEFAARRRRRHTARRSPRPPRPDGPHQALPADRRHAI